MFFRTSKTEGECGAIWWAKPGGFCTLALGKVPRARQNLGNLRAGVWNVPQPASRRPPPASRGRPYLPGDVCVGRAWEWGGGLVGLALMCLPTPVASSPPTRTAPVSTYKTLHFRPLPIPPGPALLFLGLLSCPRAEPFSLRLAAGAQPPHVITPRPRYART